MDSVAIPLLAPEAAAAPGFLPQGFVEVGDLIAQGGKAVTFLKEAAAKKLGEFEVEDEVVLEKLDGRNMLTVGTNDVDVAFEAMWRRELGPQGARKVSGWAREVTVEAYVVRVRDAAAPDRSGLLQPLLRRWQVGALNMDVFGYPAVQAIANFKWETFGFNAMFIEAVLFAIWLLSFTAFVLLFQDEDVNLTLEQLLATSWGRVQVVLEAVSLVAMAPFLYIELSTLLAYGLGWLSAWNLVDMLTYTLQIVTVVMHLGRIGLHTDALSIALAAQCVLLWFRLQYFSRVFRGTRFSFMDSVRQVVQDALSYFIVLLLLMWGFACAFCILFRKEQNLEAFSSFSNVGTSMFTMFKYALSGADLDVTKGAGTAMGWSVLVLTMGYQFIMCMVIMNLIIGVICSSVSKVAENEALKHVLAKVELIDELESTLPSWLERANPHWYPAYIHFLVLKSDEVDDVAVDDKFKETLKLVAGNDTDSDAGSHSNRGATSGTTEVDRLAAQVTALQSQVSDIAELLRQVHAKLEHGKHR